MSPISTILSSATCAAWAALLAAGLSGPAKDHQGNPVLKELLKEGLDLGDGKKAMFPAPTMDDGLDAAGQKKVVEKLIAGSYQLDNFVRDSVVAPSLLRMRTIEPSDPQAPARGIDFWFVAYGDWAKISDKEFLEKAWGSSAKQNKPRPLTAADLAKRNITVPKEQATIGYGTYTLFSRVEISGTGLSCWSQTPQSFIAAAKLDQQFDKDAEFANQWRSVKDKVLGPPHPYHAAGYYMKLTRMHEPAGSVFVEVHVIFAEPMGWFDGANFLRSKMPLAVQTQVHSLRREFLKVSMP